MLPESTRVPAPVFVIPAPVPEMSAETVRSAAALVESAIENVRVAPPRSTRPERVEPKGLPVAVKVTVPPSVSVPEPVLRLLAEAVPPVPPNVSVVMVALLPLGG